MNVFLLSKSDVEGFSVDYFVVYFRDSFGGFVGGRVVDEIKVFRDIIVVFYNFGGSDGIESFEFGMEMVVILFICIKSKLI